MSGISSQRATRPLHEQLAKQVTPLSRLTENVLSAPGRLPKRPKFAEQPPPNDAYVNVFIEFFPEQPSQAALRLTWSE